MKITGNEPAMPAMDMNNYAGVDRLELRYTGLTIRQQFAIAAMQGLRAGKLIAVKANAYHGPLSDKIWTSEQIAKQAVADADALIAELNKEAE